MGRTHSPNGGMERCRWGFGVRRLMERDHSGIDGRIILR